VAQSGLVVSVDEGQATPSCAGVGMRRGARGAGFGSSGAWARMMARAGGCGARAGADEVCGVDGPGLVQLAGEAPGAGAAYPCTGNDGAKAGDGIIGARPRIGGHPVGPQPAPRCGGKVASQATAVTAGTNRRSASLRMMAVPPYRRRGWGIGSSRAQWDPEPAEGRDGRPDETMGLVVDRRASARQGLRQRSRTGKRARLHGEVLLLGKWAAP